ncbi:MAG: hypothetical protein ACO3M2_12690 [Pseudohongiellaceae bacterium]|jgi:hypothetical protein
MSEEWDEVIHEVRLMVERLDAFHDDLKAARNSGALTEPQKKFVDLITEQAYDMAATGCLCGGVCEAQG